MTFRQRPVTGQRHPEGEHADPGVREHMPFVARGSCRRRLTIEPDHVVAMQSLVPQYLPPPDRLDRLVDQVSALPDLAPETMPPPSQRVFGLLHQRLAKGGLDKPAFMGVRDDAAGVPDGGAGQPVFYWYASSQSGTTVRISFDTRRLLAIALAEADEARIAADDWSIAAAVAAYQSVSRGILGKMLARRPPPVHGR